MSDGERKRETGWNSASLQALIRQLATTDIDELELADGDSRLLIRRVPRVATGHMTNAKVDVEIEERGVAVIAPLAGVFYSRPSPEQPPFVSIGDHVHAGHVVALIETMKLFNEVVTEVGGEVIEVSTNDGDLVEAGAVLARIVPVEDDFSDQLPESIDDLE